MLHFRGPNRSDLKCLIPRRSTLSSPQMWWRHHSHNGGSSQPMADAAQSTQVLMSVQVSWFLLTGFASQRVTFSLFVTFMVPHPL